MENQEPEKTLKTLHGNKHFYVSRDISLGDVFSVRLFAQEEPNYYPSPKYTATSIIFTKQKIGTWSEPLVNLQREEAQQLMDELWNAGIRPIGAAGSAGQLDAVKYHLEDMRKMVFNGKSSS